MIIYKYAASTSTFSSNNECEVIADSMYEAQCKAFDILKIRTRKKLKQCDVRVFLIEKNSEPVLQSTDF